MRMELSDHPVLMFRDMNSNGALNVVYRRTDGNIGWIRRSGGMRRRVI